MDDAALARKSAVEDKKYQEEAEALNALAFLDEEDEESKDKEDEEDEEEIFTRADRVLSKEAASLRVVSLIIFVL